MNHRALFLTALYLTALLTQVLTTGHTLQAADEVPYVQVGAARTKRAVIALAPTRQTEATQSAPAAAVTFQKTLDADLRFVDLFRFLPETAFLEKPATAGVAPGTFQFTDWSALQAEILVKSSLRTEGKTLILQGFLYEVARAKTLLQKEYRAEGASDAKWLAHDFANDIIQALTGQRGLFRTQIAAVCDRSGKKEIFVMGFDGSDVRQITRHNSTSLSPAWSPDSTKLAYSVYTLHKNNTKNIDLFEIDVRSGQSRVLSSRPGINSGAAYSPDGQRIVLTLSYLGNPEIFVLDLRTLSVSQLTQSLGFDVDPTWSPDGKTVVFSSTRTGKPMLHLMGTDGSNLRRLTIAGNYNATPSWAPQGDKIVFASWVDARFDLFLINPNGTQLERLTRNQGYNEDPDFSPDGNYVVFSSDRTGKRNLYVMNRDGSNARRITYGLGNCVAPKWSKK